MLSEKEKRYCEEYLIHGEAAKAARVAGYSESVAMKSAYGWIGDSRETSKKPKMWDYIQGRREKLEKEYDVAKGQVLEGMARIAFMDPANLLDDFDDILPLREMDEGTRMAISGIEVKEEKSYRSRKNAQGEDEDDPEPVRVRTFIKKIKFNDRNIALANIARMLGYNAAEITKHEAGESFLDFLKQATAQSGSSKT